MARTNKGIIRGMSREICELQMGALAGRLTIAEKQIIALSTTFSEENIAIRGEISRGFKETAHALGRIEGQLALLKGLSA